MEKGEKKMIKKLIVLFVLVCAVAMAQQSWMIIDNFGNKKKLSMPILDPRTDKNIWWNSAASFPIMLSSGTLIPIDSLGCTGTLRLTDDYIKQLAKDGSICKVMGHSWRKTLHLTLEYCPEGDYPEHRVCDLCGKKETRKWKGAEENGKAD